MRYLSDNQYTIDTIYIRVSRNSLKLVLIDQSYELGVQLKAWIKMITLIALGQGISKLFYFVLSRLFLELSDFNVWDSL